MSCIQRKYKMLFEEGRLSLCHSIRNIHEPVLWIQLNHHLKIKAKHTPSLDKYKEQADKKDNQPGSNSLGVRFIKHEALFKCNCYESISSIAFIKSAVL